ncbi:MAG: ferritin-like domain-containing protein [Pseudohongiellaceae bacterium]
MVQSLNLNEPSCGSLDRSTALYQLAKLKAWNVETALDWPNLVVRQDFPFTREGNLFAGYAEYEALGRSQQIELAWLQHSQDIGDILYGERTALVLTAQILSALNDSGDQLFLASQVLDEARHIEFFSRYQSAISRHSFPPARELVNFFTAVAAVNDADAKLLACQAVLEPLAMVRFRRLRCHSRVPLLRKALGYIARDEARHTAFGTHYLACRFQQLNVSERQVKMQEFYRLARQLGDNPARYLNIAARFGFDLHQLLAHLRSRRSIDRSGRQQLQHQMQMSLLKMNLTMVNPGSA